MGGLSGLLGDVAGVSGWDFWGGIIIAGGSLVGLWWTSR